jgi:hypothetical protein
MAPTTTIKVVYPDTPEFLVAASHVQRKYFQLFGTFPSKPQIFIVAWCAGVIVSTVGVDMPDEQELLPCHYLYLFDWDQLPKLLSKTNSVQFGRWTAENSMASLCIAYAVCMYCYAAGKRFAWIEQRADANASLVKKGIISYKITARLLRENIPQDDASFYVFTPDVYVMELLQATQVLHEKVKEFVVSGRAVFELECLRNTFV